MSISPTGQTQRYVDPTLSVVTFQTLIGHTLVAMASSTQGQIARHNAKVLPQSPDCIKS